MKILHINGKYEVHAESTNQMTNNMKILLINPPYRAEQRYGKDMAQFGPCNEPLGLAYLAGMLEKRGHDVRIWDGMVDDDLKQVISANPDVIGITMLTPMYNVARDMVNWAREMYPDSKIVVGGAHPTALPAETLADIPEIDYIIGGEGEYKLLDYVERVECVLGSQSDNLDDLPLPARHLLPMDKYQMTASRSRHDHAFTVICARGCPFNCGFCSRIHGKKVRFHGVDRIIQEIDLLVTQYGAKEINLEADTITVNKGLVHDLCNALVTSGLSRKIRWTCESRVDTVTPGMVEHMQAAGCWQISYGVETGAQRLLDLIQKGTYIEQIERAFAFTKKAGLSIRAFFMLGLPSETPSETQATIDFARKLDAEWSQFTLYTPFPGTALWSLARQEAPISKNWSDFRTHAGWTEHKPAWVPKGRSPDELKDAQKQAYRAVYLQPKAMLRQARKVRTWADVAMLAKGFKTVVKTALPKSKLIRVDRKKLAEYAESAYVDSPVYYDAAWPIRELNWRKLDAAVSMINGQQGRALDLGCGNGVLLPTLSRLFGEVVGVDRKTWAAEALINDSNISNVQLVEDDACNLPFGDSHFDIVFATSSLEHFHNIHDVTREIERLLKPGGTLIWLSPTENILYRIGRKLLGYKKPHDHYWTAQRLEAILNNCLKPKTTKNWPVLPIYRMGVYEKET